MGSRAISEMSEAQGMWDRIKGAAVRPVDPASVAAFRVLFGALVAIGAIRFLAYGWVDQFFSRPTFFFHYLGFSWVEPLPHPWMHVAFGLLACLGIMVSFGALYRPAIIALFVVFTYIELIDVTGYLNHYYLVSVVALWMCLLPMARAYSVDAKGEAPLMPAWVLWALRLQVACVYFYAAIAKATGDWLVHAQPLEIWLAARTDVPMVGMFIELLGVHTLAMIAAWAGFLHDLLVAPALLYPRTRKWAFAMLLGFHFATHLLFNIGMFPLIMTCAATIFLSPSWPRALLGLSKRDEDPDTEPTGVDVPQEGMSSGESLRLPGRVLATALLLLAATQVFFPLRAFAYGGNVLWHEQGMRFAWRVMCREKNGSVRYRVRRPGAEREVFVSPGRYLTDYQEREMSGQPDLILQLAHHIADEYGRDGERAEVRADALVSLNGRRMAPLIDPAVNLAAVPDGHGAALWIEPPPAGPPHHR